MRHIAKRLALLSAFLLPILATTITAHAAMPQSSQADGHAITVSQVTTAVTDALLEQGAADAVDVSLSGIAGGIIFPSLNPTRWEINEVSFDARASRWQATLRVWSEQGQQHTEILSGRYSALVEVPVLARRLFGGDRIERADIAFAAIPEYRLRSSTITRIDQLVGKVARRVLREGKPVAEHEIQAPRLVNKGDIVQVNYRTPYLEIRALGEALEDAAEGQRISLKNTESGALVRAVVIAPGMVEIVTYAQLSQLE